MTDYDLAGRTSYLDLPAKDLRGNPTAWRLEFARRNPGLSLDGIRAFHLHFGPTFVQLEPLFRDTDAFVLVSFHGYDASEVLKQRGGGYYATLFARANAITVPSTAMRDVLIGAGCPAGKLIVHHYGATPEPPAAAAPQPGGPVRLLTIARMVEKKGLDDTLRALARLPNRDHLTYRIIGEGPLRESVERLIAELHLESCVTISGFVPHDDVAAILATTDIFVLTSRTAANGDTEGLPVCLIEAQMAGLPVISTFHAGIPELVHDKVTGLLCEEGHVPQIAAAMATLIADPALRTRYGAAARAHALEHFNLNRLNDRLAEILTARPHAAPIPVTPPVIVAPDMPLISVCIPTYNRAAFIGDCLASVLAQADARVEILVVDDGSTDSTEAIVRACARPEIRYVRKAHTNGADTRNTAVAEATGEYILWVDSDDLLMPGAIVAHRHALRAHPDADVFYGNLKVFGDTRRFPAGEVLYDDYRDRNDYLLSRLVSHNRVPNGGTMIRASLYARVGTYDPAFIRAHDYQFWCRAAAVGRFVHIGAYTCLWRWHDSNMSSSSVQIDTSYEARVLKQLLRDHPLEALFPYADWTDAATARISSHFQLAKAFLKWRDTAEVFAHVERAVDAIHPGWRLPTGSETQRWQTVQLLVNETFKDDLQTRSEFSRGIDALRKRTTASSTPAAFDRAFYEKKLTHLAGSLKTRKGDVATTEQLKAELLVKTIPRTRIAGAPLVSVVIPFYQQADTIAATLDSLGAQTYRGFEVIIVSDGDPAFPNAVLAAFTQQNPDIAVTSAMKPHSGLAATRNWAIERANGHYILPLDSDDLIASIFLEKTVPVLEGDAALGFVYTETLFFGEKNEIWSHVDFDARLILHRNLMTCTTLFRRDMWEALGGYNTNMTHGYEDWDFWIGAVDTGYRAANIHLPLFMYRRKKQSMLAGRQQFDRLAKEQIVANHPALYHAVSAAHRPLLDRAAIGRIPEALIRAQRADVVVAPRPTAARRVLFVCHDFPPYRYAGAQLYALNLAKEMKRQGLADVHILHPVFREHYERFAITQADFESLKVFRLSKDTTVGYDHSITHPAVEQLLDEFLTRNRYDSIHIHGLGQLSTAPIAVAQRHGIPTVMTLHDYWMLCAFWHLMTPDQQMCSGPESTDKCAQCFVKHHHPQPHLAALTPDFMRKRSAVFHERFQQLDAAVAPSRYLAETFAQFGFRGVQVNPLGMPAMTRAAKTPHAGIVLGFVGQIIPRKGIEVLLNAFLKLNRPDVSLEIWGKSTDQAYLDRIARVCAGVPNVHYKGGYAPDQLPAIFAGIDVAVVPSFMENYPLVVQEAFMNGTPVVASRAGGIPEVVVHNHNGRLFETGNATDLERELRDLVSHPEKIAEYAANIAPVKTIADDARFYAEMYPTLRATAAAGAL